jgi:hypothetical protein
MASKQQQTGMRGVYLVAAELAKQGFVVSPTSRNAAGADLLVTNQSCRRAYSVQVKTNEGSRNDWLLSKSAKRLKSPTHIYVFVNLLSGGKAPEYFVVPSRVVATRMGRVRRPASVWYWFEKQHASRYRAKWQLFGRSTG